MNVDYLAIANEIFTAVNEGKTRDRHLLLAWKVEELQVPEDERQMFADMFSANYASVAQMASNSYNNFKSACRTICKAKTPATIADIVAAAIRSGEWCIPQSYVPTFYSKVKDMASENEIRDKMVSFIAEKSQPKAGKSTESRFKNLNKCLKNTEVEPDTWSAGVDELEKALADMYGKHNASTPKSVTNALESIRNKPKKNKK